MARGEGDQLRGCLAFVEKKVVRLAGAVILSALMLMNLVLAVIAIRSTDKLNGPLGFEIFLSLITIVFCGVILWKPLPSFSKKMAYVSFALSILFALLWLVVFLWLAIANTRARNSTDDDKKDDAAKDDTKSTRRSLQTRADDDTAKQNISPTVFGCIVLNIFFGLIFIFNTIYIQVRLARLYPKYAELNDTNNAFDARMNDDNDEQAFAMNDHTDDHSPERPTPYSARDQDTGYRPQYREEEEHITPPERTGYSPHGYLHSPGPTAYVPPHQQGYGPSASRPQFGSENSWQNEGSNQYLDDNHARTGQWR